VADACRAAGDECPVVHGVSVAEKEGFDDCLKVAG
jgi:hypothetical protein